MSQDLSSRFANTAANHIVSNASNMFPNLNENHIRPVAERFRPHAHQLINHLQNKIGGSAGSPGGGLGSGGSLYTGGGLHNNLHIGGAAAHSRARMDFPQNPKDMYHYMLNLSPHQFEAYRETATQMLGGAPSPMWDKITDGTEPLETDANDYEDIMKMPNTHSAAKMVEADSSSPTGGGFFKALRHVGRKVTSLYKVGRGAVKFVDRNRDLLLDLPGVRDYKEGIGSFLDSANAIDEAVNPLVDAVIDASSETATPQSRQKLKQMAEKGIDKAIDTHLPQARKYVDAAKDASNTYAEMQARYRNQQNADQ